MTHALKDINLAEYEQSELEGLQRLFSAAAKRNRQKMVVAMVGVVATDEALQAIEAALKAKTHATGTGD